MRWAVAIKPINGHNGCQRNSFNDPKIRWHFRIKQRILVTFNYHSVLYHCLHFNGNTRKFVTTVLKTCLLYAIFCVSSFVSTFRLFRFDRFIWILSFFRKTNILRLDPFNNLYFSKRIANKHGMLRNAANKLNGQQISLNWNTHLTFFSKDIISSHDKRQTPFLKS